MVCSFAPAIVTTMVNTAQPMTSSNADKAANREKSALSQKPLPQDLGFAGECNRGKITSQRPSGHLDLELSLN
jgi:hypothetical protein